MDKRAASSAPSTTGTAPRAIEALSPDALLHRYATPPAAAVARAVSGTSEPEATAAVPAAVDANACAPSQAAPPEAPPPKAKLKPDMEVAAAGQGGATESVATTKTLDTIKEAAAPVLASTGRPSGPLSAEELEARSRELDAQIASELEGLSDDDDNARAGGDGGAGGASSLPTDPDELDREFEALF